MARCVSVAVATLGDLSSRTLMAGGELFVVTGLMMMLET